MNWPLRKASEPAPTHNELHPIFDFAGPYRAAKCNDWHLSDALRSYNTYFAEYGNFQDSVVREARYYKDTTKVQHEYIIVTVQTKFTDENGDHIKDAYLRFDRACDFKKEPMKMEMKEVIPDEILKSAEWPVYRDKVWPQLQKALQKDWEIRSKSFLAASLGESGRVSEESARSLKEKQTLAVDTICRLPDDDPFPSRHVILLETLTFYSPFDSSQSAASPFVSGFSRHPTNPVPDPPLCLCSSKPLYFRDFMAAAHSISNVTPQYNALLYHCYWFCQTLFSILRTTHACVINTDIKGPLYDKRAGKYQSTRAKGYSIDVMRRGPQAVEKLGETVQYFLESLVAIDKRYASSNRVVIEEKDAVIEQKDAVIQQLQSEKEQKAREDEAMAKKMAELEAKIAQMEVAAALGPVQVAA
ncbi:hypothetical protein CVT24_001031 [Panaeolus cyanescens]|uniref:Uncharacterized protein n=1 Tax=Panaeolus cyanescens TaxID=181874 RepID=A0A409YTM6_9AGAR|nr:hypothetical protein CVT24_001031 [Panaeolus cyanescens]